MQDQSLLVFRQIIDWVDVGGGQLLVLVLGLVGCRVDQLTSSSHLLYQGELSSIVHASSPCAGEEQGMGPVLPLSYPLGCLTHTCTARVSSAVLPR